MEDSDLQGTDTIFCLLLFLSHLFLFFNISSTLYHVTTQFPETLQNPLHYIHPTLHSLAIISHSLALSFTSLFHTLFSPFLTFHTLTVIPCSLTLSFNSLSHTFFLCFTPFSLTHHHFSLSAVHPFSCLDYSLTNLSRCLLSCHISLTIFSLLPLPPPTNTLYSNIFIPSPPLPPSPPLIPNTSNIINPL